MEPLRSADRRRHGGPDDSERADSNPLSPIFMINLEVLPDDPPALKPEAGGEGTFPAR